MNKVRRPTAQDYIGTSLALDMSKVPTRDEFIHDMNEQWESYFTESEKKGPGAGVPGPVNFKQYLQESMAALLRQRDEIIPKQVKENTLEKQDAAAATELLNIIIEYEERELALID